MTLENATDATASSAQRTPISRFEPFGTLPRFAHMASQSRACCAGLCSAKSSKRWCLPSSTTTLLQIRWKHMVRTCCVVLL